MYTDFKSSFIVGFCNKYTQQDSCYISHRTLNCHYTTLQNILLRTHSTFSKLLIMFVGVSKFRKTNLLLVDRVLRLVAHTSMTCCWRWPSSYCLSCVRSLVSSLSSSSTVLPHSEFVRQSAFWTERHQLSFQQTCGSEQSRSGPSWLQNLEEKCSSSSARRTFMTLMNRSSLRCVWRVACRKVINDAINEWHKRLCAFVCAKWGHLSI